MKLEELKKQLQAKQNLMSQAWNTYHQLLGQVVLLQQQVKDLEKNSKDGKKK